jgi:hypothetical protein
MLFDAEGESETAGPASAPDGPKTGGEGPGKKPTLKVIK